MPPHPMKNCISGSTSWSAAAPSCIESTPASCTASLWLMPHCCCRYACSRWLRCYHCVLLVAAAVIVVAAATMAPHGAQQATAGCYLWSLPCAPCRGGGLCKERVAGGALNQLLMSTLECMLTQRLQGGSTCSTSTLRLEAGPNFCQSRSRVPCHDARWHLPRVRSFGLVGDLTVAGGCQHFHLRQLASLTRHPVSAPPPRYHEVNVAHFGFQLS